MEGQIFPKGEMHRLWRRAAGGSVLRADVTPKAGYDRQKWAVLLQYDEEVAAAAKAVRPLGQKWLDELAAAHLIVNNNKLLPAIVLKIMSRARQEQTMRADDEGESTPRLVNDSGSKASFTVASGGKKSAAGVRILGMALAATSILALLLFAVIGLAPGSNSGGTISNATAAVVTIDENCHKNGDQVTLHGKIGDDAGKLPDVTPDQLLCVVRKGKPAQMDHIGLIGRQMLPMPGTVAELQGELQIDEQFDSVKFAVTNVVTNAPTAGLKAPLEENAAIGDRSSQGLALLDALVVTVRNAGYACTSVSAAIPMFFHHGYSISCDQLAHSYGIEDKDGTWIVRVE